MPNPTSRPDDDPTSTYEAMAKLPLVALAAGEPALRRRITVHAAPGGDA